MQCTDTDTVVSVKTEAGLPNFRIEQLLIESTQKEFKDKNHYDTLPIFSKPNFTEQENLDASLLLPCFTIHSLTSRNGKD